LIFLTLGTQLPFDRLVRYVDEWAARTGRGAEIRAQIPEQVGGSYRPTQFASVPRLTPTEFQRHCAEAAVIVSHAGMGSIITALSAGRPIVICPRRGHLGEHRNDHQMATARRFGDRPGIVVAETGDALGASLDRIDPTAGAPARPALPPFADPELLAALRAFLHD